MLTNYTMILELTCPVEPDEADVLGDSDVYGDANAAAENLSGVPLVEMAHPDSEESKMSDNEQDEEFENQDVSIFLTLHEGRW